MTLQFENRLARLFTKPDRDEMTPAQRERLAIVGTAGTAEMAERCYAETHLLFMRGLVKDGKVSDG